MLDHSTSCESLDELTQRRILHWVCTGQHKFASIFVEHEITGREASCVPTDLQSELDSSSPTVARKYAPLIPTPSRVNEIFLFGKGIWHEYVSKAKSLPYGRVPCVWLDAYSLMHKVPPLPRRLPRRRYIKGQSCWHIPTPEFSKCPETTTQHDKTTWDSRDTCGPQKSFSLFVESPIEFGITSPRQSSALQNNGLAIITMCWLYIFSIRFLELQERRFQYSCTMATHCSMLNVRCQPGDIVVPVGNASPELVRWLCALLAPGLGWYAKGPLPPWTAHYQRDIRFVVATQNELKFEGAELPPSSKRAADLLVEFCSLFRFGSSILCGEFSLRTSEQPTVGFLSALLLPFHHSTGLQPSLPRPELAPPSSLHHDRASFPAFTKHLRYFMTLSMHPASVGSAVWSTFWQHGVDCTLVTPWFCSILDELRSIIAMQDFELLLKTLSIRRPQLAPFWMGLFALGDHETMAQRIVSYLEHHYERYGFGSLSTPDVDMSAWTGCQQSFLHEDPIGTFDKMTSQVPRSDLLRYRLSLRMGDPRRLQFGWEPPGCIAKASVELELWPIMETNQLREYKHWIWWTENGKEIQCGFREGKINQSQITVDKVQPLAVPTLAINRLDDTLQVSMEATSQLVAYGAKDVTGDYSVETFMPDVRGHPWLKGLRGMY